MLKLLDSDILLTHAIKHMRNDILNDKKDLILIRRIALLNNNQVCLLYSNQNNKIQSIIAYTLDHENGMYKLRQLGRLIYTTANNGIVYIQSLGVLEQYRYLGIGSYLLKALDEISINKNYSLIYLKAITNSNIYKYHDYTIDYNKNFQLSKIVGTTKFKKNEYTNHISDREKYVNQIKYITRINNSFDYLANNKHHTY